MDFPAEWLKEHKRKIENTIWSYRLDVKIFERKKLSKDIKSDDLIVLQRLVNGTRDKIKDLEERKKLVDEMLGR